MKSLDYCLVLGFVAVVGPLAGYSVGVDEVRSDKDSPSAALADTIAASNDAVVRDSLSHPIVVPVDAPLNPVQSGQVSTAATGVRPIGVATHSYMVASGVGPNGNPAEIKVNKFGYVLCVGP